MISRGRHPDIGQQLVRGLKTGEVTNFSKNHGGHTNPHPWDSGNGRIKLTHNGLNLLFNFSNFVIQFTDEPDGVP